MRHLEDETIMAPFHKKESLTRKAPASSPPNVCGLMLIGVLTFLCEWNTADTIDVEPQKEVYIPDYSIYHNLTSIQKDVQQLLFRYPNFMKIDWKYNSRLGKPQMLLHITNFTLNTDPDQKVGRKVKMLLSYGEHAREFFPVESMFHLLRNLTGGLGSTPGSYEEVYSRHVLSSTDLHIIVMANPDGRVHVEHSHNYCWRGTSTGVDLNRNFDWEYAKKGSSADPNDEEYRGPHAFSEPECTVYKHLTQELHFDLFISFHSGIRQIYLPFADTHSHNINRQPANIRSIKELAARLASSTRHRYQYGKAMDLTFYTADGTSFDYMAGHRKIPFSLAIELWGSATHVGASCFDQFNPRSEDLKHETAEIHPLYIALFDYMIHWKHRRSNKPTDTLITKQHLQPLQGPTPSHTFGYLLMATVVIVIIILAFQGRLLFCQRWQHRRRIISLKTLSSTLSLWGFVKSI
ncbi:carboxypeptidase A4-like [Haliotis rufescens]|uniref:carboxypeptidase A4-like n=1 Tax=Haliotis rufescens TaxID=6454 RepID=UPI00201EC3C7|nr:carboxypeptidase A4-like [Haliotis rufescens]